MKSNGQKQRKGIRSAKKNAHPETVQKSGAEYYALDKQEVLKTFLTTEAGLTSEEAKKRL